MNELIIFVQTELKKRGLYAGKIDGIMGPMTLRGLKRIDGINDVWSEKRTIIAFIQIICKENNIEVGKIDGLWGPKTEYAFESYKYLLENGLPQPLWREEDEIAKTDVTPSVIWPKQTYDELVKFYGNVGENQVKLQLPYPHVLAWDTSKTINKFSCHNKVHDSLKRVLEKVLDHYGLDEIKKLKLDQWGGCLSVRKIRGGSSYSMHSWGCAVDYDPTNNQLKWGRDRASFAKPEYDAWWSFWEGEGWMSLGRKKNYDWMHVQAAIL